MQPEQTPKRPKCEACGEVIFHAVPRKFFTYDGYPDMHKSMILCVDCAPEPHHQARTFHLRDVAAKHDAVYHGDQFWTGEW